MLMLTLGVLLWSVAHLFKRLAPAAREGMGDLGKLVVTVALIGSLVMMISQKPFLWFYCKNGSPNQTFDLFFQYKKMATIS
jgi:hypothetical protein